MDYEYVFNISGDVARRLEPIDLASVGFLERQHLEEWLITHPVIFGDDVKVVTSEFDRWQTALGDLRKDRLDILGIDSGGQLVVVELKRDAASRDVDLQALKYAALVSRFDDEALVDAHQRFLSSRAGEPVASDTARASLEHHIDGPIDAEAWVQPRIILVANSFPEVVTNTVVWLSEAGIEIKLLRYQLYRTDADPLLVVSQIYPVPETEDFLLTPRREEVKQAKERSQARRRSTDVVKVLAAHGEPAPGTILHLEPTGIREELRQQILEWLEEDSSRAEAEWTGEAAEPLRWLFTGELGKPSTFATRIVEEATGVRRSLAGPTWWRLDDGTTLAELAARLEGTSGVARDWSDLHALLEDIPEGRWTTYGDVAALIGTAPQPLGQHLATCDDCPNAYRVLTREGKVAANFQWSDPSETRTAQEILEEEGVFFNQSGEADPDRRLHRDDLLAPLV